MFAVIKTGGKQYLVEPGKKIKIEKINNKTEVTFSEVLLLENPSASSGQGKIEIGTPLVKGAKVLAKVIQQGKGKKVIAFKFKAKKRYKRKQGHRQAFTEVEITKIEA